MVVKGHSSVTRESPKGLLALSGEKRKERGENLVELKNNGMKKAVREKSPRLLPEPTWK